MSGTKAHPAELVHMRPVVLFSLSVAFAGAAFSLKPVARSDPDDTTAPVAAITGAVKVSVKRLD
jgi:hypothetical protein